MASLLTLLKDPAITFTVGVIVGINITFLIIRFSNLMEKKASG